MSNPSRSLPEEIIEEILSRLPVKTLVRFKSASKSLLNLITRPEFVKLHLCRSLVRNSCLTLLYRDDASLAYFDFDQSQCPVIQLGTHPDVSKFLEPFHIENDMINLYKPKIVGICNGVVCFRKAKEFVLYNPATRAYKRVPIPALSHPSQKFYYDGFVYDCISDDFKIFSFIQPYHQPTEQIDNWETYLYKLKDNSWSKIESPPRGFHTNQSHSHIADNNNSLYWITYHFDSNNTLLTCIDVSSHRYEEMALPIQVMFPRDLSLTVLKGRLHVIEHRCGFKIWMFTDDSCWTQVFHCLAHEYDYWLSTHMLKSFFASLYTYTKDGCKIIIGSPDKFTKVICCDLESQTISVVQVVNNLPEGSNIYTAIPWTESLVPLA